MSTFLHRRLRSAAPLALSLFALTACTNPEPTPPPASSTATHVFANEEKALAAVTELTESFISTVNAIGADGGRDAERLQTVLTSELLEEELAGFTAMAENGWHTVGTAAIRRVELFQWWEAPDAVDVVAIARICIDYSNLDVVNDSGVSVVSADRDQLRATQMQVISRSDKLLISNKTPIAESDVCA